MLYGYSFQLSRSNISGKSSDLHPIFDDHPEIFDERQKSLTPQRPDSMFSFCA